MGGIAPIEQHGAEDRGSFSHEEVERRGTPELQWRVPRYGGFPWVAGSVHGPRDWKFRHAWSRFGVRDPRRGRQSLGASGVHLRDRVRATGWGSADGATNAYLADFARRESIIFGGVFRTRRRARAFP